ncbi:gamma-glutamylcyclotransferase [Mangrovivirga sp. M17]|uniref:Gamma-glutamylcyclotransferase n=1 Tax=Mangrovivirga halotolerans TaxID=2993936 RepID=A0ABT3RWG8_9BACT|nr:gamma-glutamylcyclotransferase family protein [Mangrovivirga halotolerans]MCX2745567.1 gamma-glutamylcyclotransferase [Mangrovivirga halotolerans]
MNKVFAYGTLRDDSIQKKLFSRLLKGIKDSLCGFRQYNIQWIENIDGKNIYSTYPAISKSGNDQDLIDGYLYELTDDELLITDEYEGDEYQRIIITTNSGTEAFVYIEKG